MNGRLSRRKDKTVSKEETGAMVEHSIQPGELVATPEDQLLCHKIKKPSGTPQRYSQQLVT
jgi:hypothetical protein